jgi:hypothetical protein
MNAFPKRVQRKESDVKTTTYKSRSGRMLLCPVIETDEEMYSINSSEEGFCLGCGNTHGCVEPDARRYPCEVCGEGLVFGFQELLLMGLIRFEDEAGDRSKAI